MDSVVSRGRDHAVPSNAWLLRAWVLAGRQKYSCFLGEHVPELAPRRALATLGGAAGNPELRVNTGLRYQPAGNLPDEMAQRGLPLNAFLRGYPIAWIDDPGVGLWTPFWARDEWADALLSLRPGMPAPAGVRPAVRQGLAMADILVPRGYEEARRDQWETTLQEARAPFQDLGHTVVRNLLHPLAVGALRKYYRELLATGAIPQGDWLPDRYGLHSEMIASFLHIQLAELVSRLAGERVKPSFVYLGSYRPGAVLPRHTDRPQCEFTISLLVDYEPDPDGPCGWPLYMESPRAPGAIARADLALGDGAFYRGREVVHYRDPLPDRHQATLLFLNYVREDFAGRLW